MNSAEIAPPSDQTAIPGRPPRFVLFGNLSNSSSPHIATLMSFAVTAIVVSMDSSPKVSGIVNPLAYSGMAFGDGTDAFAVDPLVEIESVVAAFFVECPLDHIQAFIVSVWFYLGVSCYYVQPSDIVFISIFEVGGSLLRW